jgi:hypothetical protein
MTKLRISLHLQAREEIVETFLSCVLFTEPGILIFKSTASALMEARSWPYFDPDYETIGMRISPPRVVVDNDAYDDATLVKVRRRNKTSLFFLSFSFSHENEE